jgi:hypothetical protein
LRQEVLALDLSKEPLKMKLGYARVLDSEGLRQFEAAIIKASVEDGSSCEGNSMGTGNRGRSGAGGGAGWIYGWTIVDDRVKWWPEGKASAAAAAAAASMAPTTTESDDDDEEEEEEEEEYEIERIVGKRWKGGVRQYRVQWKGYGNSARTWEPEENLRSASMMIDEYNHEY